MRQIFVLTLFQMHQFELSAVGGNWDVEELMAVSWRKRSSLSNFISSSHLQ